MKVNFFLKKKKKKNEGKLKDLKWILIKFK